MMLTVRPKSFSAVSLGCGTNVRRNTLFSLVVRTATRASSLRLGSPSVYVTPAGTIL
jgi:hypothetical protein